MLLRVSVVEAVASLRLPGDFEKLWAGVTISAVGSQVTSLAVPLTAVLLLGAGPVETGVLIAARMAPMVLFGLFVGVWVDRLPRRPILVAADLSSLVVIGSVPVAALFGVLHLGQLYAVAFIAGALSITSQLARSALVPTLVGREALVAANSRLEASYSVAQVAGPSLGGLLVQAISAPFALVVDAASFLLSALLIWRIRAIEQPPLLTTRRNARRDIIEGLKAVRQDLVIFPLTVSIAVANVEWFAVQGLFVPYASSELGLPPPALGLVLAVLGPASFLGATLVGPISRRWGVGPTMLAALLLESISRLLLALAPSSLLAAVATLALSQALVGFVLPLWDVNSLTLRQLRTPDRLLGRVNAAANVVAFSMAPIGALLGGWLGSVAGPRTAILAAGLLTMLAFVYLLGSPIRQLRARPVPADSTSTAASS